jgi:putative nucleotidyltransferase with HDIG domain
MTTRSETRLYAFTAGTDAQRQEIRGALPEIERLPAALAEPTLVAWATAWQSSPYASFAEIPMAIPAPRYGLCRHTRDVAGAGLALVEVAEERLGRPADRDVLLAALLLHDVDSPLIYERAGDGLAYSDRGRMLQHGVLGAMLLREAGAPDEVVSLVATHAMDSPFHRDTPEGWILYYADLFAADHALMTDGSVPVYRQKRR